MKTDTKSLSKSEAISGVNYDVKNGFFIRFVPELILRKFRGRKTFQTVFINSMWMSIYTFFLPFLASFIVTIGVARYLGPDQFGILTYIFTFSSIFLSINFFGMDNVVFRNLCRDKERDGLILGTAITLRILAGIFALLLGLIVISRINPRDHFLWGMVFIVLSSNVVQAFNVIEAFFQSRLQVKAIAIVRIVVIIAVSVLKMLAIIAHAPLFLFIILGSCDAIFSAFLLYLMYRRVRKLVIWKFDFSYAKRLIKDGLPLMLAGLTFALYTKLDQVILKSFRGNSQLGQYAIALGVVEAFNFLPLVITNAVAPLVVHSANSDQKKFSTHMENIYRAMLLLSIFVGVSLFFIGRPLLPLIFGQKYAEASYLLGFVQFRLFFTCFSVARGLFITSKGMFKFSLISQISALIVGLSLNFILIPRFGVYGLLLSSLVSLTVSNFIVDIFHPLGRQNLSYIIRAILTPHKIRFSTEDIKASVL